MVLKSLRYSVDILAVTRIWTYSGFVNLLTYAKIEKQQANHLLLPLVVKMFLTFCYKTYFLLRECSPLGLFLMQLSFDLQFVI